MKRNSRNRAISKINKTSSAFFRNQKAAPDVRDLSFGNHFYISRKIHSCCQSFIFVTILFCLYTIFFYIKTNISQFSHKTEARQQD